jgi:hypothetical protein
MDKTFSYLKSLAYYNRHKHQIVSVIYSKNSILDIDIDTEGLTTADKAEMDER